MSSNITICSRCGKRIPTYTLQNSGWEEEQEGMWTCAECLREVQSSQNRNFVTPRARRQPRQEPGAPSRPILQRQNAFNLTRPQRSRRSISSNSAFNTWTPQPQSVSSDTHRFSTAEAAPASYSLLEEIDMYISDDDATPSIPEDADDTNADEFPIDEEGFRITYAENPEEYMYWLTHGVERWRMEEPDRTFAAPRSDSVSPSDFQDLSSVGVGSSAAASPMVVATSRPANPQVAQARRTKTEAIRELEAQIAAAHNYNIEATSVNRSASTYDVINMEDTRVRDALNERDETTTLPKNIVFQRDDNSSDFVVIPKSHLYNLLHEPSYLNSTLYKCYNVREGQLMFTQNNILKRGNGSLKFINGRLILPQIGGYFLKRDLITALRSGHRFFIYHVHEDIQIGPMISASLISWTTRPSQNQIREYLGPPDETPWIRRWSMNSNELGSSEDLEGAIHCGHGTEPMITFKHVSIRGPGRQSGIDPRNILSYGRRSGSSNESKQETQRRTRKGGRRKKKKRKTRRRKRNKKTKKKKKRRKTRKKRRKKHKKN